MTDTFSTAVRGCEGCWPPPPHVWSYSSLREATECPRRWMLSRARYPKLWDQPGYPPTPNVAALAGDVVHLVLERLAAEFRAAGCLSLADPSAVAVLKSLGGYTKLVDKAITHRLEALAVNPRADKRLVALRTALHTKVPELRQRVQAIVARMPLATRDGPPPGTAVTGTALAPGAHPEQEIFAQSLRLMGRVDLLTIDEDGCDIIDYKTGGPDDHHRDQLRLYALIWNKDEARNPRSLPVRRLIVSYPSRDVDVHPPDAGALDQLAAAASHEIDLAEAALARRPPPAQPEPDLCRMCSVRQLCDDYWASSLTSSSDGGVGNDWFDFEGAVSDRNGARSWLLSSSRSGGPLLLRVPTEKVDFAPGDRVRLLNLRREDDEECPHPVAVLTQSSEVFLLTR